MASEIRVNQIQNRSGLGTVTFSDSGVIISGITTISDLRTSSAALTVGTGASVSSPATNVLTLGTNNSERVRIDSSGNIGIGSISASAKLHIRTESGTDTAGSSNSHILFDLADDGGPGWAQRLWDSGAGSIGLDGSFALDRRSGGTWTNVLTAKRDNGNLGIGTNNPAATLHVTTSTGLGVIQIGNRNNNTQYQYINFNGNTAGDSAWQIGRSPSSGVVPNGFYIYDVANSTTRLGITTTGGVILTGGNTSANGVGIAFPATQSASTDANTLDDYEEGTWTPGISFDNNNIGMTYANQQGWYTKIGRMVTVSGYLTLANKGSSTGTAKITGLPFTVANASGAYPFNSFYFNDINPSENYVGANSFSGGSQWFSPGYFGVDKSKVLDSGDYYNYVRFRRVQTDAYAWCLLFVTKSSNTYTVTFSALINVAAGGSIGEEIVIPLHCGSGGAPSAGHTHGVQQMYGSPIISGTTYLGWLSGNGGAYNSSPSGGIYVTATSGGQIDYVLSNTTPTAGQTYTVTAVDTGSDIHIGVFRDYIGGSQFSTMNLGGYADIGSTNIQLTAQKYFSRTSPINNRLFKNTTQIGAFCFNYFV